MSRWRPPLPKSSPYITAEGYHVLERELKQLWERRKHVTVALSAVAAEGDRSENAEEFLEPHSTHYNMVTY
jgi:transcription elongation factor GreB